MVPARAPNRFLEALSWLFVLLGAAGLTLLFFLVLPWMQTMAEAPPADTLVRSVDVLEAPPPPPPEEEKPEDEPEPEPPAPELAEESPPLDLAQLELALNASLSGDWLGGDFAVKLNAVAPTGDNSVEALFSLADLDQKPRAIHQPGPIVSAAARQKAPGTVQIIFIVDERGRVESPQVQSASDPAFEAPALAAVKQWVFEPGKRNGEAVRFRMRVPITFPKAQ